MWSARWLDVRAEPDANSRFLWESRQQPLAITISRAPSFSLSVLFLSDLVIAHNHLSLRNWKSYKMSGESKTSLSPSIVPPDLRPSPQLPRRPSLKRQISLRGVPVLGACQDCLSYLCSSEGRKLGNQWNNPAPFVFSWSAHVTCIMEKVIWKWNAVSKDKTLGAATFWIENKQILTNLSIFRSLTVLASWCLTLPLPPNHHPYLRWCAQV